MIHNKKVDILSKIYSTLILLFLYAPIAVLIIYSFNSSKSRGVWGGFTLNWYVELFKDSQIMKALYYTLIIAVLSSAIATLIGTIAAIGIHNMKKIHKTTVLNINNIPVLNPDIVTGVSLMILFISIGMKLGFMTVLLSHLAFNIPYVILSVLPKLRQLDPNLYEAAQDLGANPVQAFLKVVFPEIMPGIISGAIMAFTMSLDDFVISFFTTGNGVTNLSITIYSMARRGINPKINALSTLLFIAVLSLLFLVNKRNNKNKKTGKETL
jgi:spermidine/putrescine transport system permease protein